MDGLSIVMQSENTLVLKMNEIMNERIKKLANHAGFDFGRDWQIIGLNDYSLKTYTELLIKECIEVCERQQYYDADDSYKKGVNSGTRTCVNALKRNFGFE
jgi:hypothetical protein